MQLKAFLPGGSALLIGLCLVILGYGNGNASPEKIYAGMGVLVGLVFVVVGLILLGIGLFAARQDPDPSNYSLLFTPTIITVGVVLIAMSVWAVLREQFIGYYGVFIGIAFSLLGLYKKLRT